MLQNFIKSATENAYQKYSAHLTSETEFASKDILEKKPIYSQEKNLVDARIIMRDNFDAILKKHNDVVIFGEDAGFIGDVNQGLEGLQEKSTNAVSAISRGQKLTQESLSYSGEVVVAIDKVGIAFQEVDNLTSQIASGTQEQQSATSTINDSMMSVVSISRDINEGLSSAAEYAQMQQKTSSDVEKTLNRICV